MKYRVEWFKETLDKETSMFSIEGGDVWVGGLPKGKLSDLILFIGKSSYGAKPGSKNGFALFNSGNFYIQRGPDGFEKGVENPRLYDGNTYWGNVWSWGIKGLDHVIWIVHRRYIVPFGGSIILFEDTSGKIGSTHNGGPVDRGEISTEQFLKSNPVNDDGVIAIGPGAVAGGVIAIGGDLNVGG